jgi:tyrosyl-DNA phosphodiesterase 2
MCLPTRTFTKASRRPPKVPLTDQRLDFLGRFPYNQPLHRFDSRTNTWKSLPPPRQLPQERTSNPLSKFHILSWNIEFSSPFIPERTTAILDYLQTHTRVSFAQTDGIPTVILLQEVDVTAFPSILSHAYLQAHYDLTDISTEHFRASYGTVTLVPRTLTPFTAGVVRIPFPNSIMGRDVLIVDLELPQLPPKNTSRIRIGNTHLESARGHADIARPQQLDLISQYISSSSSTDGGLVAGDMNAIIPIDEEGPRKAGLVDCWEALHPDDNGYTWGYQPPSEVYPCGRLDKVLLSGNLSPISIERVGMGEQLAHPLNSVWLSDHYGLLAQFTIS